MDTILYLYQKKDLEKPLVEAIGQKTYLLIKIGMDVESYRWFLQSFPRKRSLSDIFPMEREKLTGWKRIDPGYFRERKEIRRCKKEWKRYEALIGSLMDRCRSNVESQLAEMQREISFCAEERSQCQCVYDRAVRAVLHGGGPVAELWQQAWNIGEFTGFMETQWARLLLPHTVSPHFIVLGEAPCIPELLQQCAGRMKSLRWIVSEAWGRTHAEELEGFAEDFYQEQGLAVTIEQAQGGFEKLRLLCKEPVNILDFTGEDKVSARWATKGSAWLDLGASEEKCRLIAGRSAGIQYVSLREIWRRTQKRTYRLDTAGKNEYNT
ncbi:MAG: hypothetical protein NC331_09505 [Lachnospiraceae bacterium]|nr:hypothetical protein [Lachnospiraceae bacterium]MCM1239607.1 hypothetical protein [Lachnospiraceae bacterium]